MKAASALKASSDDAFLTSELLSDYLEQASQDPSERDLIRRNEFGWFLKHAVSTMDEQGTLPPRLEHLTAADARPQSTDADKRRALRSWLSSMLRDSIHEQAFAFAKGLTEVIPRGVLALFSAAELQGMLCRWQC